MERARLCDQRDQYDKNKAPKAVCNVATVYAASLELGCPPPPALAEVVEEHVCSS